MTSGWSSKSDGLSRSCDMLISGMMRSYVVEMVAKCGGDGDERVMLYDV